MRNKVSISYAITVCSELNEIEELIPFLLKHKGPLDEVVVMFDNKNGTPEVWEYLQTQKDNVTLAKFEFNNDFAEWKNRLAPLCKGQWIFNIDADEYPTEQLLEIIHDVLDDHEHVDVFWVPRRNYVEGITKEYIAQMNWTIDKLSRINWPDMQLRIYKNRPDIYWSGKVHESLTGYKTFAQFPASIDYLALYHEKTFAKQLKANEFYATLQ
jgi:glycosyltransferase involved in cell wall biosynthesis